ncbi:MAG: class I SAM-dependent rRNA methyltransferase [Myxococcota bacterium]
MIDLVLVPGRDRSLLRRHPWVLSGSVARSVGNAEGGALVRVLSAEGEPLGFGHLSPHSVIRVRMVAFGKEAPADSWLEDRIQAAVRRRGEDPLLADLEGLRLVNAEGDGLPGLVVDRYGDCLVVKLSSAGMANLRQPIAEALRAVPGVSRVLERADAVAARQEGLAIREGVWFGEEPEALLTLHERGRRYEVDVRHGQKTGFYLDQREARDLVQRLADGRRVLDLFSYTGGFAVAAVRGGAHSVTLVDSSEPALALARRNLRAAPEVESRFVAANAFRFVRADDALYDLLVVDPPPLARRRRDLARATRAYKDVILHALHRAAPGAFLLVFSCSHHVGADLFRKVVFAASLDAGRPVQVLGTLGPPSDHPVSLDHPEGDYLCGLLLRA